MFTLICKQYLHFSWQLNLTSAENFIKKRTRAENVGVERRTEGPSLKMIAESKGIPEWILKWFETISGTFIEIIKSLERADEWDSCYILEDKTQNYFGGEGKGAEENSDEVSRGRSRSKVFRVSRYRKKYLKSAG